MDPAAAAPGMLWHALSGVRCLFDGLWSYVPPLHLQPSSVWEWIPTPRLGLPLWFGFERAPEEYEQSAEAPGAARAAAAVLEQFNARLDAMDFAGASKLLDVSVEWQTPQWRATGRDGVREEWESGRDAKWGVTPVWRALQLRSVDSRAVTFTRDCDTFRVLGWPIRLRQTFDVARQGLSFIVRRAKTERL